MSKVHGHCAYVWTYRVDPAQRQAFEEAYGPNGVWNRFFSQSPGYIRTDLLADAADPDRFSTIDYFKDANARAELVAAQKDEFDAIDQRWENATIEETFIGMFNVRSDA